MGGIEINCSHILLQCVQFNDSHWTPDNCRTGAPVPASNDTGYYVTCVCSVHGPTALFEGSPGLRPVVTTTAMPLSTTDPSAAATGSTEIPTTSGNAGVGPRSSTASSNAGVENPTTTIKSTQNTRTPSPTASQSSCEITFMESFEKIKDRLESFLEVLRVDLATLLGISWSQISHISARAGECGQCYCHTLRFSLKPCSRA